MAAYWPWPRSVLSFYGPCWKPISPQLTVCIDPMRMYWACVHSSCILSARTRGTRKLKALNQPKKMKWRGGGREGSFLGGLSGLSNPMLVRRKDYTDWMSFQVYILNQQPGLTLFYKLAIMKTLWSYCQVRKQQNHENTTARKLGQGQGLWLYLLKV